ncbi:MAG: FGGY-family carbohydrate kinase [Hydrococcus sp. C42_A2020_068]|uniref:FGGY-family carbohydrate kinase n=1 Tax=Pleurocapsa sp. PCC 7327 TaxID=118163 RepID=UPI00029FD15F|nr:FGGY-family carbohydrate kinase [Pleurocapsa sp. PCC 7327]AFY76049.1 pentulose/hexulose kinase [Pleurocapsa sp. PCC 7327]MBF2021918.1 FGGY-family carbohydrate kinase [Hydrococcus sp. C42_A2020_068]
MNFYLGIDFGTSGARAIVIDSQENICSEIQETFKKSSSNNLTTYWQQTLFALIEQIPLQIRQEIRAIAIDGTSSTVLLCDKQGNPINDPILYNDGRGMTVLENLAAIAPPNHLVLSATSSLAKLFWWYRQPIYSQSSYFLHQADWLAFLLHGKLGISDYHNALKLGYDVENLCYPNWLEKWFIRDLLPQVLSPGTPIDTVKKEIAYRFNLRKDCLVCAGTTDSIAAFLASGATNPGEAVTSLGSTLVLKLLSHTRVENSQYGIYSHRFGDLWLTGGASNTGGVVLRYFFSNEELERFSRQIDATQASHLDYYPLLKPGDRFPINDPQLPPKLEPRPEDPVQFLHGLLESMARIEALGYRRLQELGATPLRYVYTAGGGAKNPTWEKIRKRYLQVPVVSSDYAEAAYGTALLAKKKYLIRD